MRNSARASRSIPQPPTSHTPANLTNRTIHNAVQYSSTPQSAIWFDAQQRQKTNAGSMDMITVLSRWLAVGFTCIFQPSWPYFMMMFCFFMRALKRFSWVVGNSFGVFAFIPTLRYSVGKSEWSFPPPWLYNKQWLPERSDLGEGQTESFIYYPNSRGNQIYLYIESQSVYIILPKDIFYRWTNEYHAPKSVSPKNKEWHTLSDTNPTL